MHGEIRGSRPRPRVALVGAFEEYDLDEIYKFFPTVFEYISLPEMENKVDQSELDLIVISNTYLSQEDFPTSNYFYSTHVICFSPRIFELPGPEKEYQLFLVSKTETEEYLLPPVNLPFNRQREVDFQRIDNTKGWNIISLRRAISIPGKWFKSSLPELSNLSISPEFDQLNQSVLSTFFSSSILSEPKNRYPLAIIFTRIDNKLGIAWLPNDIFDIVAWTKIIAIEWSKTDPERFPYFGNWVSMPDWMTSEEAELFEQIQSLELEKIRIVQELNQGIGELSLKLTDLSQEINLGKRRLLTNQGADLVNAVENAFIELGFKVKNMDNELDENVPKREDLRLSLQNNDNNWEAIVEVRGYSKSAGKTSDFQRLDRFAKLYQEEKGQFPDKQIYVVNGEIDLLPPQRQEILASADEDITVFAENDGLIISTIDLYKVVKDIGQYDLEKIRQSIVDSLGRWKPPI